MNQNHRGEELRLPCTALWLLARTDTVSITEVPSMTPDDLTDELQFECAKCGDLFPEGSEELCLKCQAPLCTGCFNATGGICADCQKEEEED